MKNIDEDLIEEIEHISIEEHVSSSVSKGKHAQYSKFHMIYEPKGWNIFSEELSLFIYDFFKHSLTPYEKLIFYSYFINGWTLKEIADAHPSEEPIDDSKPSYLDKGVSFQLIAKQIEKIEKKISERWKNKKAWRKI